MARNSSARLSSEGFAEMLPSSDIPHQKFNPLVKVILVFGGLLGITMSTSFIEFFYVAGIYTALCLIIKVKMVYILRSIRIVIPWALFFFIIHLVFIRLSHPRTALSQLLFGELIVLLRIIGLAGVMGILRKGMNAQSLVDSVKTLSDRLGIKSRFIEDFLQTLRLILLFIPQVIREYRSLERFNLALGFKPPSNLREKIRFFGGNLLPVMSRSLSRAHQVGTVMSLRGYGQVIPRGQLTPVSFTLTDIGLTMGSLFLLTSVSWMF
ncbi:energy-coupling factor transporter transmembrane component T family protein [Candidatus Neomarinimicrobiota bacterium]